MADKQTLMAAELRQIIQADRTAASIIQDADDTRQRIEQDTEEQKAQIAADTERARADLEAEVRAEQEEALAARKVQVRGQIEGQEKRLTDEMAQNRAAWLEEITKRITAP